MVESALCFLAFMFLVFGLMEVGMTVYAYNFCTYGADTGARWASVHGTNSTSVATNDAVQTVVRNQSVGLTKSNIVVTTTWSPDKKPGSVVQVQVAYTVTPLIGLLLKGNQSVSSISKVVITN